MKLTLSALSILCTCLATASSGESWLKDALAERENTFNTFAAARENSDEAILTLTDAIPEVDPNADTTMPESPDGDTVAVSDGGMLFDVEQGRLVYLNNVRVVDERLRLRCSDRLYIQLPESALHKGEQEAKSALKEPSSVGEDEEEDTTEEPNTDAQAFIPICIEAATAMVNSVDHKALIIGSTGKPISLSIIQGENKLILKSAPEKAAQILADTNGDIVIQADCIDLQWQDSKGRISRLQNSGGLAYYRHSDAKLLLTGTSHLETPDGSVRSTKEICLYIQQEKKDSTGDSGNIMPQFNGIRIAGINGASAQGNVELEMQAKGDRPALSMHGDSFAYNGRTGECSMSGEDATINYGENSLSTNGSVLLAENGNITMKGDSLRGRYFRPAATPEEQPLRGEFFSHGDLQFIAETGVVHITEGVELKDDVLGSLTINGPLEATLQRNPNAELPDRESMGMINPLIMAYTEIETLKTSGGIVLHYTPQKNKQEIHLNANAADINMRSGEMTLSSAPDKKTELTYIRTASDAEAEPINGSFRTAGIMRIFAADGIVQFPQGVDIKDSAMGDFAATGPVEVKLAYTPTADTPLRNANGLINPAIIATAEIEAYKASGGFALNHAPTNGETSFKAVADAADINMRSGEMLLSSTPDQKTELTYLRPATDAAAKPTSGALCTTGTMRVDASNGIVQFPQGVTIHDSAMGDFEASGPVEVKLAYMPTADTPLRNANGLINPAVFAKAEVESYKASGGFVVNYSPTDGESTFKAVANAADINMRTGNAVFTPSADIPVNIEYRRPATNGSEAPQGKLVSSGEVILNAEQGTLIMPNGVNLHDTQMGGFSSTGAAEIRLAYPAGAPARNAAGLIEPAALADAEIESFKATENVVLNYISTADNTKINLEANAADINMRSGLMSVSSAPEKTVNIHYTRPSSAAEANPLSGTFTATGTIIFNAEAGTLHLPEGVQMVENGTGSLHIGGATDIKLAFPQNTEIQPRTASGLYNPAYFATAELETVHADGGIAMNYINAAEGKTCALHAEKADIDLRSGAITLTTSAAGKTQITYDTFSLIAESQNGNTSLVLAPNGDLTMLGEKLTASLPTADGAATLECTEKLTLLREAAQLELGAGAIMRAPQGRITANGPLMLTLAEGPAEKARPLLPQCPQLVYNFSGLKTAETAQGGTIQTKEAALRCAGRIHVAMDDTPATGKNKNALPVKEATAEDNVAVTGKDAGGRILTAFGDKLTINGSTGEKRLSGEKVILQDGNNTLTASGNGAAVIVDKKNNVRITGAKQSTSVSNLRNQVEKQQKTKK